MNNCASNSQIVVQGKAQCNLIVMCTIILELQKNKCDCLSII